MITEIMQNSESAFVNVTASDIPEAMSLQDKAKQCKRQAVRLYERALEDLEKTSGHDQLAVVDVLSDLGALHEREELKKAETEPEVPDFTKIIAGKVAKEREEGFRNKRTAPGDEYGGRKKAAKIDLPTDNATLENLGELHQDKRFKDYVNMATLPNSTASGAPASQDGLLSSPSSQTTLEKQAPSLEQIVAELQTEYVERAQRLLNETQRSIANLRVKLPIVLENSQLGKALRANAELTAAIAEISEQLAETQQTIAEREAKINENEEKLSEAQSLITEQQVVIAEKTMQQAKNQMTIAKLNAAIDVKNQILTKKEEAIQNLRALLTKRINRITELQTEVVAKTQQLDEAQKSIADHEVASAEIAQRLTEAQRTNAELKREIVGKDQQITDAQLVAASKAALVDERDQQLTRAQQIIAKLKGKIAEKTKQLDADVVKKNQQMNDAEAMINVKDQLLTKVRQTNANLKSEIAEKTRQLNEAQQQAVICCICLEAVPNRMWKGCNHLAACSECVEKLNDRRENRVACPKCRKHGRIVSVFI